MSNNGTGTFLDTDSARAGLGLCLAAYVAYGAVAVILALSLWWCAASWFASAMGAWTLYGPAAFVADPYYGTGIIGLVVYALFTGLPLVMVAYMGSSVRSNVPNATSVSSYARWRFGKMAEVFVMAVVLFCLVNTLLSEYIAIGGIFQNFFGCSPYVPLIVVVRHNNNDLHFHGGLYISIITDMVQTALVLVLVLVSSIYLGVTFHNNGPLPPMPEYLGATTAGWKTLATIAIPLTCATFFSDAFWQRVWSAENNRSLRLGAIVGGVAATVVVFILGFGGILAYWSGRALIDSPNTNSNFAFFYAFADPSSGNISSAIIILILLFATVMDESAVDSLQNAITDVLATFAGFLGIELGFLPVRALVIIANIPIMAAAAYCATNGVSILNAYGISNMLTTMCFPPLAAGLIPQLNNYLTTFSSLGACFCSFITTLVYGVIQYGNVNDGMTALWWTSAYDWEGYLIAFFSSILFVPILIGVEFAVRAVMGWGYPSFDASQLVVNSEGAAVPEKQE
ncbi:hypothetical protein BCR33DRAFT_784050 [Rhizoclosmatium globosum]|uniref:Uncharacterized protein n=1 Tax=Rhizoclosmatium globosum TaxID=329046 RepID=A0A1Y2CG66_9FUNG|nr:hypothetical protein BCR33DRAFT_784050 [Rhizoclosmatium globosum]|eukprot:ORY45926.1 hypothetical protein BCR33DRAFT_784050 [Rhizoclosmatium globosum]